MVVVEAMPVTAEPGTFRSLEHSPMLGWALVFLVVALVAAALGFGGIAGTAAGIAKVLFIVFLILFAVGLVMHLLRGRGSAL